MVAQVALMAAVAGAWFLPPRWPARVDLVLDVIGALLVLTGLAVVVAAGLTLGRALTPVPEPRADAELQTDGAYALVRHPIYGGGILVSTGSALLFSAAALVPTAALSVLWWAKSREEERRLARRFPDYAEYAARTRWRLIPFVV